MATGCSTLRQRQLYFDVTPKLKKKKKAGPFTFYYGPFLGPYGPKVKPRQQRAPWERFRTDDNSREGEDNLVEGQYMAGRLAVGRQSAEPDLGQGTAANGILVEPKVWCDVVQWAW